MISGVKMVVSVIPGSVKINVMVYPRVNTPEVPFSGAPLNGMKTHPKSAGFTAGQISLSGEMTADGDATGGFTASIRSNLQSRRDRFRDRDG